MELLFYRSFVAICARGSATALLGVPTQKSISAYETYPQGYLCMRNQLYGEIRMLRNPPTRKSMYLRRSLLKWGSDSSVIGAATCHSDGSDSRPGGSDSAD